MATPQLNDVAWWSYVTNVIDEGLTPQDIAEVYSLRWRIEIFFRHLKHTLNMGHWFAESEAGAGHSCTRG